MCEALSIQDLIYSLLLFIVTGWSLENMPSAGWDFEPRLTGNNSSAPWSSHRSNCLPVWLTLHMSLSKSALARLNCYRRYTEISCLLMGFLSGALRKPCSFNLLEGRIPLWYSPSLLSNKICTLICHDCNFMTSEIHGHTAARTCFC